MAEVVKKYLHEYTVDQVINEVGFYQKIYIDLNFPANMDLPIIVKNMVNEDTEIFNALIYNSANVISFCPSCNKSFAFQPIIDSLYGERTIPVKNLYLYIQSHFNDGYKKAEIADYMVNKGKYFTREYRCSYNRQHGLVVHYKLDVEGEELVLTKIGQWPSVADLQFPEDRKYRKILGDDYYKEYTKAIGLFSHGIGIGSFVYLRRIYENLVEEIHTEFKTKPEWKDSEYTGKRFNEKVDYLESLDAKIFPEEITDIKTQIYSVISKGIHEYTEEECMNLFEPLKFCIEAILDHKHEKEERMKKGEAARKALLSKQ